MMIKLTTHASEALALRCIEMDWVVATVTYPDTFGPDSKRAGVMLAFKRIETFGNRVLRVAYRPDGADILIITVFFDRGAKL